MKLSSNPDKSVPSKVMEKLIRNDIFHQEYDPTLESKESRKHQKFFLKLSDVDERDKKSFDTRYMKKPPKSPKIKPNDNEVDYFSEIAVARRQVVEQKALIDSHKLFDSFQRDVQTSSEMPQTNAEERARAN